MQNAFPFVLVPGISETILTYIHMLFKKQEPEVVRSSILFSLESTNCFRSSWKCNSACYELL